MACVREIAEIFQGFLVPVIAVITVCILIQEARTRRDQYRLNLYEKRFAVFNATRSFLQDILRKGNIVDESAEKFWQLSVTEASFLFEDDVVSLLKEMRQKCSEKLTLEQLLYPSDGSAGIPVGDERVKVNTRNGELLAWFVAQTDKLAERFSKYLDFRRA